MYYYTDTKNYTSQKEYKNNRLLKLQENFFCEVCKKEKAIQTHHKDKSKINHSLKNLIAVCKSCHSKLHSKFYKIYGYSIYELQKKYNKTHGFLMSKHNKNQLKVWLFLMNNKYPVPISYSDSEKLLWIIEYLETKLNDKS